MSLNNLSNIGTQTVGTGADTLSLFLAEDQYAGDVNFTVFINNQQVGGAYAVQALQSQGQDQEFLFNGNWGDNSTVTVNFTNGACDGQSGNGHTRELYIDGASYDGNALVLPANSLTGEFANTSSVTLDTNATTSLAAASDTTVAPGGLGSLLSLSGYHLTYDDEFDTMPTMSPFAGQAQYDTTLDGFPNYQGMRILGNGDQQYYTDSTTGDNPFSVVDGALDISATYVGAGNTPGGGGATGPSYTSGQITTEGSFSQQYGYFEMRAQLPQGAGMWPAFWMLPQNSYLAWNPELDVMEAFGAQAADGEGGSTQSHWAIHASEGGEGWETLPNGGNEYTEYHTYGVLWTPQTIALYIDGSQVGQIATPSDFTKQMYMIVNLAVGGSWPGDATGENAKMSIDYLRAYSSNISLPAVALQKISAPDGNVDTNLYGATALNTPNTPPILAVTSLALARDTGISATDYVTNDGSVTFSGTVQDASPACIDIYDNGTDLGAATIAGANWTFATMLGAGSHSLSAKASDTFGHVGSIAATQTITVETTPPIVAITSVTSTTSQVTVAGTVSGAPGTTVELYSGTTALAATTLQGNGSWNATLQLSGGTYDLTARALDLAGNTDLSANEIVTVPPPAVPDNLTLAVSEDAWEGDAQFTVSVDGTQVGGTVTASALHSGDDSNVVVLTGNWGSGAHNVQITFINGAHGGSPTTDRNLYVNSIAYDGVTYSNTAAALLADSPQNFAVGGTAAGTAPADALTLHLSEDAWNGNAQFQLLVDGKVVTTPQQVVASHSAGAWQDLSFSGSFGAGSHAIGIQFLNDAYGGSPSTDRNLYVDGIDLNGTHYGSGVTALYANSTANFVTTADEIATVPPPAGPDNLTLAISEDAWEGDAQFTVSVDDTQVGGTMRASALHSGDDSNVVVLTGNWGSGAHNVQITFINDAYDGSPTTDRNLYMNSIAYDGVTYSNTAAALFADGSQNFAVGGTAAGTAPADALTLHLSEDAWNGNAQFQLLGDGKVLTTPQQVVASHSAGAWQDLSFSGSFGAGSHTIGIQFLNDACGGSPSTDRNLYVDGIDLNGTHYGSGVTALYTNSTANFVITTTH